MEGISSLLAKYLLSTSKAFKALLSARQANYQFLFDLEKAENLQIACEVAHQETDATSLVRRIVSPLPWYVSLCPVDFVKTRHSNTLLQECRGILGMSTRTSACFAPFPHALRLNC